MSPPFEHQNPTLQFDRFMVDARDSAGLPTEASRYWQARPAQ